MPLTQHQLAQVQQLLAPLIAPDPRPEVHDKLRHGYQVEGNAVVFYESRPRFQRPREWHDHHIAKFRYVASRRRWLLYCQLSDLKWHRYEPLPESPDLETLVREVERDPTGIFFG